MTTTSSRFELVTFLGEGVRVHHPIDAATLEEAFAAAEEVATNTGRVVAVAVMKGGRRDRQSARVR